MEYTVILDKLIELNGNCWVNITILAVLVVAVGFLIRLLYPTVKLVLKQQEIIDRLEKQANERLKIVNKQTTEMSALKRIIYKLEKKVEELIGQRKTTK